MDSPRNWQDFQLHRTSAGGTMIHQLLIAEDMRRCQMACAKRVSVLISGIDVRDSSYRVYGGLVKSVEDFPTSDLVPDARWRITIQA
jgi:hypothetical protein